MYNILICDDERDIVSALKIYLGAEGYGTFCAYTGKEALDILAKEEIHLVLMDIMMPVMDGLTATKTIRALDRPDARTIPIIAMTANVFREDANQCIEAGMNAHLAKPLEIEKVKRTICEQIALCSQYNRIKED